MTVKIYVEGGGDGKYLRSSCREGFRSLFTNAGVVGAKFQVVACGPRNEAFRSFCIALAKNDGPVLLLVDSEDSMSDISKTWEHLGRRDGWKRPKGADDETVLMMTTTMETWLVADREALAKRFGKNFRSSALPPTNSLEVRPRNEVLEALESASKDCSGAYRKDRSSFLLLGQVNPKILQELLPSFRRALAILKTETTR